MHVPGQMSRDALTSAYREHDILVFASTWEEPLGITLLEAMASGLAVVGTGAGGSAEILQPEVNALTFPRSDVQRVRNRSCALSMILHYMR